MKLTEDTQQLIDSINQNSHKPKEDTRQAIFGIVQQEKFKPDLDVSFNIDFLDRYITENIDDAGNHLAEALRRCAGIVSKRIQANIGLPEEDTLYDSAQNKAESEYEYDSTVK